MVSSSCRPRNALFLVPCGTAVSFPEMKHEIVTVWKGSSVGFFPAASPGILWWLPVFGSISSHLEKLPFLRSWECYSLEHQGWKKSCKVGPTDS